MQIVVVCLLFLFGAITSQASTPALSLKEAIRFALENSPSFDSAKKTQSVREMEVKSSVAKMLPSADLSTTDCLQNNIPISGAATPTAANPTKPWYSTLSLGITENIYDNGVSLTNLSIANLNRDLAQLNFLKTRDSLALDISAEFYRFSLASMLVGVRKQQQGILEKQFKTLSNQYQQGFKTKSDYLRLKTQVQRAEIDRVTAENAIALSVAELRRLLGVSYESLDPPSFAPLPVDSAQKIETQVPQKPPKMENSYNYRIAKIQGEVNGKSVSLAERKFWPQVSFSSGITYLNQNYLNSPTSFTTNHQLSWNALVTLQFNFWDWGTRRRDIVIAEYNRDIQENSLNQGLLDVNAKMIGVMAEFSRISRNYKLSHELLTLEEESYRNLELQYREGKLTYLDLITGLTSFLDAKVQFFTAYFDSLQAISKYKFYEGRLYETITEKTTEK